MSSRKSLKEKITEAVLAELPKESSFHDLELDKVIFNWWWTGRQEGLRLTDAGNSAFELAEIEFYEYEFKIRQDVSMHSFVLELSKKVTCPYYLGVHKSTKESPKPKPYIRLYDSKVAMWVGLYGDFLEYLDATKNKR